MVCPQLAYDKIKSILTYCRFLPRGLRLCVCSARLLQSHPHGPNSFVDRKQPAFRPTDRLGDRNLGDVVELAMHTSDQRLRLHCHPTTITNDSFGFLPGREGLEDIPLRRAVSGARDGGPGWAHRGRRNRIRALSFSAGIGSPIWDKGDKTCPTGWVKKHCPMAQSFSSVDGHQARRQ